MGKDYLLGAKGSAKRFVPIADPAADELGPAMLACTELQRRFVIGWIAAGGKNAAKVARAAGYSDVNGGARVAAYHIVRHPKIQKALHEEAGRQLNGMASIAVARLQMNLHSSNPKVAQIAIDSILDRTGFPRRTERSLDVTDTRQERDYEQLLTMVYERLRVLKDAPKAIEAPYTEMEDVGQTDAASRIEDKRPRDNAKARPPNAVEVA